MPVLFGRLARALAERGRECRVVDYADGALAREVRGVRHIELLPFEDDRPVDIGPDSLLVMQAILPATMRREMRVHPDTRVLFWVLYVMNLVQVVLPFGRTRDWQARSQTVQRLANRTVLRAFQQSLRAFVRDLAQAKSLVFMDGSTWRGTQERLEVQVPPVFVPVTVDVPSENPRRAPRPPSTPVRAGWLGRLDDFKVGILNHTIAALARHANQTGRSIDLVIVGDGPLADQVMASSSPRLTLTRRGTLTGPALTDEIAALDILFAMGTSALEGARLGVPTVLLDFSYGPVPADYQYRWIFEARDFELGRLIDASLRGSSSDVSLGRVLDRLSADPDLSQLSFDHCRRHHSLDAGLAEFDAAARQASYRFGQIDPALRQKGMIRRTYETLRAR